MTAATDPLVPGQGDWLRLVTASKVAAILGVSPWESPYSLWRRMRGELPSDAETEVQSRGHFLEPAILAWWEARHRDRAAKLKSQPVYRLGDWAAATPDAVASFGDDGTRALVEAKSAAHDDEWGDPGTDAIPDYYLVQTQWQMHVSGIHRCYVPMIGPRLRFSEYVVDYDPMTGPLLERRCRAFYDSLTADEPPPLDGSVATLAAAKRVHPEIDRGVEVEVSREDAAELAHAAADLKAAEARDRQARAVVVEQMGRAQHAVCGDRKVARRQGNGSGVSLVAVAKPDQYPTEHSTEHPTQHSPAQTKEQP